MMDTPNTTLAQRIRKARIEAELTQMALADKIGCSQTAVHKLEKGHSRSSRRTIKIALACQVDPIWLETGRGDMRKASGITALTNEYNEPVKPATMSAEELFAEIKFAKKRLADLEQELIDRTGGPAVTRQAAANPLDGLFRPMPDTPDKTEKPQLTVV